MRAATSVSPAAAAPAWRRKTRQFGSVFQRATAVSTFARFVDVDSFTIVTCETPAPASARSRCFTAHLWLEKTTALSGTPSSSSPSAARSARRRRTFALGSGVGMYALLRLFRSPAGVSPVATVR